jgi:hypothetical protein
LGEQVVDRLAPRSRIFLSVHADAIGLVAAEALRLRMIRKVLLKPRSLADEEHLVFGGPTSASTACHDVHGSDRMKLGIDRKDVKIVSDVGIA